MSFIAFAVTSPVLAEVQVNVYQRQLAIQDASPDVRSLIDGASAANRVPLEVGGCITLVCGDTGAIWAAHQAGGQAGDFDDLFSLLSRRPDRGLTFSW